MQEISRINHVGIRVSELQRSREFYTLLGFNFIAGPIGPEPVAIMEHPCGININFILNASSAIKYNMLMDIPEKHTGYTHMALEVTSMDAVMTALKKKNIVITEGPIILEDGTSFIFIRDPDNNVIEFHQPAIKSSST